MPVICGHCTELKKPIEVFMTQFSDMGQIWGHMGSFQGRFLTLKIHVIKCLQICTYFHEREIGWFDNDTDQSKLDTKFFILNFVPIKNENSVSKSLPKNWDNSNDLDYLTYDHVIQS